MRSRRGGLRGGALGVALALAAAGAARAEDATPLLGPAPASGSTPASASTPAFGSTTALESYLVQPGRLLVERTYGLAPIALEGGARLALEAIVAYEPAREHERVLGVRARLASAAGERVAYLDLHEVEDLARSLAALPAVAAQESGQQAAVEIRYTTRGGLGVAVATGSAPHRRQIRFAGAPALAVPLSEAALGELRVQLDGCRRYLFEE